MNQKTVSCPYCGTEASAQNDDNFTYVFVECPTCGRFKYQAYPNTIGADIRDKVASFLYYTGTIEEHDDFRFFNFIGTKSTFDDNYEKYPWCYFASIPEIEAFYPRTFSERIDRILLGMAKRSEFFGNKITYTRNQLLSAMFVRRFNNKGEAIDKSVVDYQLNEICQYLDENKYIEAHVSDGIYTFVIKVDGYKRIDELQTNETHTSKNVFVAMSFADDMKEVRESIKAAITENGYIPRIMDEIEHNHQIVPEMLYEIRQAKFVIAELTGHNNGAYFEAGYALGCGKEVIQLCSKERFGTDGHFDVKQINTILWDNTEDLAERLSARIKATIK